MTGVIKNDFSAIDEVGRVLHDTYIPSILIKISRIKWFKKVSNPLGKFPYK